MAPTPCLVRLNPNVPSDGLTENVPSAAIFISICRNEPDMPQFRADIGVTEKAVTTAQGILIGTQTTMPQPSVYNVGCTVKYVGSAGTYTPGRYYTCVQDGAGYAWQEAAVIATGLDLTQGSRAVATDANGMAVATNVTAVELGYLGGVTSALQGQLNGKVPTSRTINGKALTDNITLSAGDIGAAPASAVLEASRALQSSSNGEVSVSNVTSVELSYLSGVTSAIQTQLNNKADNADIPTLLSQLTNDTGFVTNAVSDLINYYTKADTYTKTEINNMISAIPKFSIQVVQSLPSSGISTTTIYLVPKTASTNDSYDEYIYVNNAWEKIGSTAVNLEDYYTKAQVNAMVTPVQSASGITINGVALQAATASQQGLMTVAQVGQLATAVSNAQSALNGNVTGGTFSTDSSGNLTLTLNRTAGALNIGPTALTAAKAVADGSGNNIASTYATQSALSSGLASKADAGTEITGGAFSNNTLTLNRQVGNISIGGFERISSVSDITLDNKAYTIDFRQTFPIDFSWTANLRRITSNYTCYVNPLWGPAGVKTNSITQRYTTMQLGYNSTLKQFGYCDKNQITSTVRSYSSIYSSFGEGYTQYYYTQGLSDYSEFKSLVDEAILGTNLRFFDKSTDMSFRIIFNFHKQSGNMHVTGGSSNPYGGQLQGRLYIEDGVLVRVDIDSGASATIGCVAQSSTNGSCVYDYFVVTCIENISSVDYQTTGYEPIAFE